MKPILLDVYFFSGVQTMVPIESYHTVKEVKAIIMKNLQFNPTKIPFYSLYEICTKNEQKEERFLDENDRICDVISLWEKEKEDNLKAKESKESIEFKIFLKLQIFYPYAETDIDTITMIYVQTVYEVINGRFSLAEDEAVSLAAKQLVAEFQKNQDNAYQSLQKNLENYIPVNLISLNESMTWTTKIMGVYNSLENISKIAAKVEYLKKLENSPVFMSTQFTVKYSQKLNANNSDKIFPENCVLALKSTGISILDLERVKL